VSLNRLHRWHRALLYAVLLALFASGVGGEVQSVRALLMKVHGAAAMATLVLIGVLLAKHVPGGWAARANRASGVLLLVGLVWLTLTGYLLYYAGGEQLRQMASDTHLWVGVAFAGVFAGHQIRPRQAQG
jgi:hypothetical protein